MHYCRFCSPQVQGSVTAKGRGRGRQCPRGGSRDPAGTRVCCGRSRAGTGAGTRSLPHRSVKVGTIVPVREHPGNAAPAAFSVPAPRLLDLRLDGAGGKTSGSGVIAAGMELSRGSYREPRADWTPGRPHHSAVPPRGRQTLRTAANASPRIC